MIIGIPLELKPGERRVAMIPANIKTWSEKGVEFLVQAGAGAEAGHLDKDYEEAGAKIVTDRAAIFAKADIILQVQSFGANNVNSAPDLALLRPGQLIAGMMDPLASPETAQQLADKNVTAVAMELVPRISRAQDMDVLSSMATLAGYKAVLLAASELPRIMPMLMTAAGTLQPARVLIMGAGVAGLQACATAKRLGAVVEAYDVRAAAREQIISVGAKPIELDLETEGAEGSGGYAAQQSEAFLQRQRELMNEVVAPQDIVITTAAVPGAKSPILVTNEMLNSMKPGSVIIDLAAERGGNCELTKLGERVEHNGVTILGPENVPSTIPGHASQMYSKNIDVLLSHIIDENNNLVLDFEDDIIAGTVATHGGEIPHAMIRNKLGLPELETPAPAEPEQQPAAEEDSSSSAETKE
ncbi:MAG: Re/Si-specific NAD(P)(+) transhydrogenase subunit alpha [Porticoccaceae bacterium]|nr:Re/Si-specific NAD(P)(+) transhydrogenase subunit alpha [Pseudomonadales bacterium]MCP5172523.1 Re/Si-specific NAD(P)(+) transhydrogenase subunit alpha [Pseudomonadales bacterium]